MSSSSESSGAKIDLTFFVPCYNEEALIQRTLAKLVEVSKKFQFRYEILIFDDKSSDRSLEKMAEFKRAHPSVNIRIFRNFVNCGLGYNYIEGSFKALGEHYVLVNGDDSETPESLIQILECMGRADAIIPYMIDVRTAGRRAVSNVFTKLVNLISGHNLRYYNGPVLHKTKNVRRWHPITGGYAYQAEILCLLLDHKATYMEIETTHNDRDAGESKAFKAKNILSVLHSLSQILLRRTKYLFWSPQALDQMAVEVDLK